MPADLRDVIDEKAGENPRASFFSLRLTWKISLLMFQTPGLIWNRARLGFHHQGQETHTNLPPAYSHCILAIFSSASAREVSLYLGASAKILTSWLFCSMGANVHTLTRIGFRMVLIPRKVTTALASLRSNALA